MGFCSSSCIQALEITAFCSRAEEFMKGWKNIKEKVKIILKEVSLRLISL